ncbi:hypothetical protein ACROYT_G013968 [Oculina patagonica]
MVEAPESHKSFASLPYIKGVTEPLTRVLKKHDITVVNKPLTTLQQQFPAPKFRPSLESQTNVVYKIPCSECSWCYIGETGRAFNTRKKEHLRNEEDERLLPMLTEEPLLPMLPMLPMFHGRAGRRTVGDDSTQTGRRRKSRCSVM